MRLSRFLGAAALSIVAAAGMTAASAAVPAKGKAAVPPPIVVVPTNKAAPGKAAPNFDAMLGLIDKLFPAQPAPDPARLALARTSVQAMWPDGAYGKMMSGMMGGMFDRMMQLKTSDLAALSNKPQKPAAAPVKDVSLHEQIAGKDPYFDQRMAAMRDALNDEMGKISAIIDPRMRDGLAGAMARRFDAQQLGDINRFFATPTGHAFAGQYMQLWVDPDTMRSLFASMPELMKLMPEMMQKLKAANDKFPKPPTAPAAVKKP